MIKSNSTMGFEVYLTLSESQARALLAITTFSVKDFTEVFYGKLGKSDLQPNEEGLSGLFEVIRNELPNHIKRIDTTRKTFQDLNPNKL